MSPDAALAVQPAWWLWIVLTLVAAAAQTARNAMQKGLTVSLGTVGATLVRFLFGLPFAALSLFTMTLVLGGPVPGISVGFLLWVALGALTQMAATALMLAAMRHRSFVVATAYVKTEAVQVALFGLVFLSERLTASAVVAIVMATAGVLIMSWPRGTQASKTLAWEPVVMGLLAGSFFAASAVGFKGAIVSLGASGVGSGSFVMDATFTLVCGLLLQTMLLTSGSWFATRRAGRDAAAWRPSMLAGFMGALASQMWFLAFAIATTAHVRTLGLVEILFAHALSRRLFSQHTTAVEILGIALVLGGTFLLINA